MKTYTIRNQKTGWKKSQMTESQVKQFCFNKLSKAGFKPLALFDYFIIDESDNEEYPLSNYSVN